MATRVQCHTVPTEILYLRISQRWQGLLLNNYEKLTCVCAYVSLFNNITRHSTLYIVPSISMYAFWL